MKIIIANIKDALQILTLQKLAYQSEALIYNDYNIPPLTQTLDQIKKEFDNKVFFKIVSGNDIIGSVRANVDNRSCFIGRLIVHPKWRGQGLGTQLMAKVESYFTDVKRFELFTGIKSQGNIRLYRRLGYIPFKKLEINEAVCLIYMEKYEV